MQVPQTLKTSTRLKVMKIIQSHDPLDDVEIKKQEDQEVDQQEAIREQLINKIEYGLEYVLETIGSNERITLPLILYKTGDVYGGEWKNGKRDGKGRLEQPDGSIFVGEWENDVQSGWGKIIHPEGDIYEGEWKNNFANGKGTYIDGNEIKCEGEWQDDKQHGKAVEKWLDGGIFEGDHFQDQRHGEGIAYFHDGSMYEGQFQQGVMFGYGIYYWDKKIYKGEWKDNFFFGKGQIKWQNGNKYTGEYKEDIKHGKGVFEWKGEKKYIGSWLKDNRGKQHGIAINCFENNTACVQIWRNGKKSPRIQELNEFDYDPLLDKASLIIQNWQQKLFDITLKEEDQIYIKRRGNNNQRIQLPPTKLASGAIYEGEWKNAMKDGKGKILYPDGSIYEGLWENNLMHGWGRQISKDGTVFEGEWLDNLPVSERKSTQEIQNTDTSIFYELLI